MRRAILMLAAALPLLSCQPAESPREEPPEEQLFAAVRAADLDETQRLLEAGISIETQDRYGSTALIMAAGAGREQMVEYLLEQGADPDHAESFYGADAVSMALFAGHSGVAVILLEAGADNREAALQMALGGGAVDVARAAMEGGPIYESQLEAMRARVEGLSPELREILAAAQSRPDPAPPALSAEDLKRYEGRFEGQTSDVVVEVTAAGAQLLLRVGDAEPVAMAVVGEDRFHSADGATRVSFYGRAGTIEGMGLRRTGQPPEDLRHSVAEPVGASGYRPGAITASAPDGTVHWPAFRGANAAGIGDGVDTLSTWDQKGGEGILWEADLPGLGNSSPVVWGDRVFITTAVAEGIEQTIRTGLTGDGTPVEEEVEHAWRVMAFDKWSGDLLWETDISASVPLTRRHFKATQANSTPVTDGEHLVVVFPTGGIACLDLDGEIQWRHELGGLNAGAFSDPSIQWGFASSPILYGSRAILQVDIHDGPYLAAWDLGTGEEAWRVERDVAPSWATPTVLRTESGDELITNGSTIHSYDPESGRELWSLGPNSELVIATPVVGDDVVYVSAGYPPIKPIYAVPAGTRGAMEIDPDAGDERLLWSHQRGGAYMPSPLLYRGIYYVVHHNGRLVAYDAGSGTPIYKSRFSQGGVFTASPVAVNGKLYLPTEEGMVYVLEAGPEYRELAINEMGEPLMATPAVSEGILLLRTPSRLVAVADRAAIAPAATDR